MLELADLAAALTLVNAARRSLDSLETQVMMVARREGLTWREIAEPLGLQSAQAAAQRWERMTEAVAPAVGELRRRVTSALLDRGVTRFQANVYVGGEHGRTVILKLVATGTAEVRHQTAIKIVAALRETGLDVAEEVGQSPDTDIAAYLAAGATAVVFEADGSS